jgi:prepilin-type N-terminal cleavage/methylation domain-containing protein
LPKQKSSGFTLIELLTAAAILAITLVTILSIFFSTRKKYSLIYQTDKLVSSLEYAHQQSVAAYKGNSFSIQLDPPDSYTILPDHKTHPLSSQVIISTPPDQTTIEFEKVTGRLPDDYTITLQSGNLETNITISLEGIITKTSPSKI